MKPEGSESLEMALQVSLKEGYPARRDGLELKLADLRGEHVNDYMLVMRALSSFMWLRLLGSGWPLWLDEADVAYMIKPFTNPIANRELVAWIEGQFVEEVREAAQIEMSRNELRTFARDALRRAMEGECLLCGCTRRMPLVIRIKDEPATAAVTLAVADAIWDTDAAEASDDEENEAGLLLEEPYLEMPLSADELAADPERAMRILSAFVWVELAHNSWQSWIDVADMDRIIRPFIDAIENKEVATCLDKLYQSVLCSIAMENCVLGLDQWDLAHDMILKARREECPLCGGHRAHR